MIKRSALLSAALVCCAVMMGCSCGSNTGSGSGPGPGSGDKPPTVEGTPKSAPPAELEGDWKHGNISFLNFWDDQGNNVGTAGGIGVYFQFNKDGTYKEWFYAMQRNYNCVTQSWRETNGTATFSGNSFTVYPNVGHYKAKDNCNLANNFERPMTVSELKEAQENFVWKWDYSYPDKPWMMIGFDDEHLSSFDRP